MTTKNLKIDKLSKLILMVVVPLFYSLGYTLFNFPQSFEEPLIDSFQISAVQVTSLYAINSSSTIPVDLLMVKVLQRFKLKTCAIILSIISASATFMTHYAVSNTNYSLLMLGRFLFGVGLESMYVVSGVATEKWFTASEVTMMSGIARVQLRCANTIMVYLLPYLYVTFKSWSAPLLVLEIMSSTLVISSLAFYVVETKYEENDTEMTVGLIEQDNDQEVFEMKELSQDGAEAEDSSKETENNQEEGEVKEMGTFGFNHLSLVPSLTWYVVAFIALSGNTILNFTSIGVDLISRRYNVDYLTAKNYMSFFPSTCIVFILGFLVLLNKIGYKSHSYNVASILCLVSFTVMALLPSDRPSFILVLCIIGVSASNALCYATSAASVLLSAPTKASSIVVAFMAIGFNLPMFAVTPFMGFLSDARTPDAYQHCLYLLILFSLIMLASSVMLYRTDVKQANRLLQRNSNDPWLVEYKEALNKKVDLALTT